MLGSILRTSLVASAVVAAGFASGVLAQPSKSYPDFSSANSGWVTMRGGIIPMPGSPSPVGQEPSRPLVANNTGQQPTFPYADLNNSNLTPFARDGLKKANDLSDTGFAMYSRASRCWATGVPVAMNSVVQPIFFVQTPKEVLTIGQGDQTVRHIYMNVPHSTNPKPSWYGESVGHYDGEWLVVDTIAQDTRTFIDNFRTPHSDKLHVVERYHLIEGGKTLEAQVTIDDPASFIQPVNLQMHYRKSQGPIIESRCADGESFNPFGQKEEPIPVATKSDF
ncbi:MAG TPA: hypothetical protein VEU06_03820 [Micropepsaceae bacterium]|nr:hypothetical protein [Micropepsaceae bacterium]